MRFLPEGVEAYTEAHAPAEPELLQRLNRETHLKVLYPRMLSGHYSGRFLAMMSTLLRPKTILEVGTYTGYSALCLAEGLAPNGKLHSIDLNPETMALAQRYIDEAGYTDRVELHEANAVELLQQRDFAPDLVFLDADKENYLTYYQAVLPTMPTGGVILTDNVLWSGKVVDKSYGDGATAALRAYNSFVHSDERVESIILPVRDGITLIRKK